MSSSANTIPSLPPPLTIPQLTLLLSQTQDDQLVHGSIIKHFPRHNAYLHPDAQDAHGPPFATPIGVSLFPSLFPRRLFQQALDLQTSWNELYAKVAVDEDWLQEVLGELIKEDELCSVLWDIHLRAKRARQERCGAELEQRLEMMVLRSDYMIGCERAGAGESDLLELKQVEVNTIACAGACHGNRVADMHRHFARMGRYDTDSIQPPTSSATSPERQDLKPTSDIPPQPSVYTPQNLPLNTTLPSLVSALATAHAAYGNTFYPSTTTATHPPETCILLLTQPHNINPSDEVPFSTSLWSRTPSIPTFHVVFPSPTLLTTTSLDPETGILRYTPPFGTKRYEVSVVYYRAGFQTHEYDDEDGVEARVLFESSRAIACPSVLGQLAGSKVVQSALTRREELVHFLGKTRENKNNETEKKNRNKDEMEKEKENMINNLLTATMPIHPLTSPAGLSIIFALKNSTISPSSWILKSATAEGGGHCVFGSDILSALHEMEEDEMSCGVIMKRIRAPEGVENVLVMPTQGEVWRGGVVSEVGVWGCCLFRRRDVGASGVVGGGHRGEDVASEAAGEGDGEEEGDGDDGGTAIILLNEVAGWSVRTKPADVDEISVVKGYGAFDSVVLVEDEVFVRSCEGNIRNR